MADGTSQPSDYAIGMACILTVKDRREVDIYGAQVRLHRLALLEYDLVKRAQLIHTRVGDLIKENLSIKQIHQSRRSPTTMSTD